MPLLPISPDKLAQRARATGATPPSPQKSMAMGAWGMTIMFIVAFVPLSGTGKGLLPGVDDLGHFVIFGGLAAILSAPLLRGLIMGRGRLPETYGLFCFAFPAYFISWVPASITRLSVIEWLVVTFVGAFLMMCVVGLVMRSSGRDFALGIVALFVLECIGRLAGWGMVALVGPKDPAWYALIFLLGLGPGFGAGFGLAMYFVQRQARGLLAAETETDAENIAVIPPG